MQELRYSCLVGRTTPFSIRSFALFSLKNYLKLWKFTAFKRSAYNRISYYYSYGQKVHYSRCPLKTLQTLLRRHQISLTKTHQKTANASLLHHRCSSWMQHFASFLLQFQRANDEYQLAVISIPLTILFIIWILLCEGADSFTFGYCKIKVGHNFSAIQRIRGRVIKGLT